jgi:hypothetical protein
MRYRLDQVPYAFAKCDKCSGSQVVDPIDRCAVIPEVMTSTAFLHLNDPQFVGWPKRVDPQIGKLELAEFPRPTKG